MVQANRIFWLFALTTGNISLNWGQPHEEQDGAVIIDGLPAQIIYGYEVGRN